MTKCPTKDTSSDSWTSAALYLTVLGVSLVGYFMVICHVAKRSILFAPL